MPQTIRVNPKLTTRLSAAAAKSKPLTTCQDPGGPNCSCCTGLECLERPRYFAGMLLTEDELSSEQTYVRAKNRLHNRYLHGWGVVCGLQVVCNDCEGYVTVKAGYAIDPCGNDMIVCADQPVNFAQLLHACNDRTQSDCDPLQMLTNQDCQDAEENWCLTLCYQEQDARPMMTLRREKSKCGCGCNGSGKRSNCGCGCHNQTTKMSTTTATPQTAQSGIGVLAVPCEPTRTAEGFRFGVTTPPPDNCAPSYSRADNALGAFASPYLASSPYANIKPNTIMYQLQCCRQTVMQLIQQKPNLQQMTPTQAYSACCQYYKRVQKFFLDASLTNCDVLTELAALQCPPLTQQPGDAYIKQLETNIGEIDLLLTQYMFDCFCLALMPPCPPDPVDGRLILACITVKGDKIIRICNFEGRRQVITMPALEYWLTGFPIWQTLVCTLQAACCGDSNLYQRLFGARQFNVAGAESTIGTNAANFSFGNAGMLGNLFDSFLGQMLGADFFNVTGAAANLYDARPYVGVNVDTVKQRFETAKIKYTVKSADNWSDEAVATSANYAPSAVSLDQPLTLYTRGNVVVGIEPTRAAETLNTEVNNLKRRVDELHTRPAPAETETKKKTRKKG